MPKPPRATIVFYDEETQQLSICTVFRREVQSVIDRKLARSDGMTIPPMHRSIVRSRSMMKMPAN